jgi:hypothetical protein
MKEKFKYPNLFIFTYLNHVQKSDKFFIEPEPS